MPRPASPLGIFLLLQGGLEAKWGNALMQDINSIYLQEFPFLTNNEFTFFILLGET